MKETKKPAVRFKGFSEKWEQRELSTIYRKIRNAFVGTATPFYVPDGHFYLESNNIKNGQINRNSEVFINDQFYYQQKDKWLHTNDMVMVQSGHVGHAAVIPEHLDKTAAHALITFTDQIDETEPYFLNYQYQTEKSIKKISDITKGNTIKHILSSDMKHFVVDIPSLDEQKQIALFFQSIDDLITIQHHKLKKLQVVKASMLEKMFPKDGADMPEVRFKGFSGAWETICLKDITSEVTRTDKTSNAPIMMITAANGFIDQSDRYSFDNAGESLAKYVVLKKGELAYNHGASKLRPFGSCFALEADEARIPYVYHCFAISDHNPYFVSRTLNNKEIEKQLRRLVTSGARMDGLLNISYEEYTTIKIKLPEKDEQDKIETFFKNMENLIKFSQQELDKFQSIKKALLEEMFV